MIGPTILWRYGMGPKPLNYALDVLVEDLEEFNALRSEAALWISEEKGVIGKEITTPKQVEGEEEEVMEAGIDLIPRSRKRPAVETSTATPPSQRTEVSKLWTSSKKKKGRLTSPLAQAAKRQKSAAKPSPPPSSTPLPSKVLQILSPTQAELLRAQPDDDDSDDDITIAARMSAALSVQPISPVLPPFTILPVTRVGSISKTPQLPQSAPPIYSGCFDISAYNCCLLYTDCSNFFPSDFDAASAHLFLCGS